MSLAPLVLMHPNEPLIVNRQIWWWAWWTLTSSWLPVALNLAEATCLMSKK
jgi:hypothetical protein